MKSMIVPKRLFISTERAKDLMDNTAKIMVTAYEVWKRNKRASDLAGYSPEQLCEMFIKEISGQ